MTVKLTLPEKGRKNWGNEPSSYTMIRKFFSDVHKVIQKRFRHCKSEHGKHRFH